LYSHEDSLAIANNNIPLDSAVVTYTLENTGVSGRSGSYTITTCSNYAQCIAWTTRGFRLGSNTNGRGATTPGCLVSVSWTVCTSILILEPGDLPTGGGTNTGGTSGGGGGGGAGSTPPESPCPTATTGNRGSIYEYCDPGWTPVPSDNPPPPEPIDSALKKAAELANKYRDSLGAICERDSIEIFFNIVFSNNQYDTFAIIKSKSSMEVKPNYYIGSRVRKAEWHYHPKYSDNTPGSWPSGSDVATLYDKTNGHIMIVDTYDARYALVVEDATKMAAWKNIFGNGPKLFPERVRDSASSDPRNWSSGTTYVTMTKEKLLACLGMSSVCGIGLYQSSLANGTSFTKIN
jgi:hypothetical protein